MLRCDWNYRKQIETRVGNVETQCDRNLLINSYKLKINHV